MTDIDVHTDWTLSFTHPETGKTHTIAATVPGNVEMDLMREGFLDDPYPSDDIHAMRLWETVDDWRYETTFDAPESTAGDTVELVFEGINTLADITLNGEHLMDCDNMFIPHTADVTGRLRPEGNALSIRIRSAMLHARKTPGDHFQTQQDHRQGAAYLRMARHMWGWDNAPRLLSAGLWRPVHLRVKPAIRFSDVYLYTQRVETDTVWIGCDWTFESRDIDLSDYRVEWTLSRDGEKRHSFTCEASINYGRFRQELPRAEVELWWPRGYGDPCLYDVTLTLRRCEETLTRWTGRMGIREIELVHTLTTDEQGSGEFVFTCNGEKIYASGANWKPLDALHSRAPERMARALDLCLDLNCNMIRIWGGGVYEGHDFFDFCDEHGLMVWQDFMFACEYPPRDDAFLRNVAHEAETVIQILRNHPSLALWCGDNEDDLTFFWDTLMPNHLLPSDNVVSRKVLKEAVQAHDPYRSYVASSPIIDDEIVRRRRTDPEALMRMAPEQHTYTYGYDFWSFYRKSQAHYVGEVGPLLTCAMSQSPDLIERERPRAERLWNQSRPLEDCGPGPHQAESYFLTWKCGSVDWLHRYFDRMFSFENPEELALAINIYSGDIFKFAIEYSRSLKWRKTGVLWWSLLDMWPMMFNYSVVDWNFKPKQPCYDWIKASQQALCLMAVESADGRAIELFAANDTREPEQGDYRITTVSADGAAKDGPSGAFSVEANATAKVASFNTPAEPELWLMKWSAGDRCGGNHFVSGKPPYDFEAYRNWCAAIGPSKPE